MVIADFDVGVDRVFVESQSLGAYIAAFAPLVEDTGFGGWLTLDSGEILKFTSLTAAEVLLIGQGASGQGALQNRSYTSSMARRTLGSCRK